jgi:hypothetical protein
MRVIAEFPDVSPDRAVPSPAAGSCARSGPTPERVACVLPKRSQNRRHKKSMFPTWSVVTLAIVAAVVWTFVAIGERPGLGRRHPAPRLATEPPPSTAPSGTTPR